jgi:hypothetical protein
MPVPADLIKISDTIWELPTSHKPGMLVPARIYATDALMQAMDDGVFEQVSTVWQVQDAASLCHEEAHECFVVRAVTLSGRAEAFGATCV